MTCTHTEKSFTPCLQGSAFPPHGGLTFWFCKCKPPGSKLSRCKDGQKMQGCSVMGMVSWTLFLHQASSCGKSKQLRVRSRTSKLLYYAHTTRQQFERNFRKCIFMWERHLHFGLKRTNYIFSLFFAVSNWILAVTNCFNERTPKQLRIGKMLIHLPEHWQADRICEDFQPK